MKNNVKERILLYLKNEDIAITRARTGLGWSKNSLLKSNNLTTNRNGEIVHHYSDVNSTSLLTGEGFMTYQVEKVSLSRQGRRQLPSCATRQRGSEGKRHGNHAVQQEHDADRPVGKHIAYKEDGRMDGELQVRQYLLVGTHGQTQDNKEDKALRREHKG